MTLSSRVAPAVLAALMMLTCSGRQLPPPADNAAHPVVATVDAGADAVEQGATTSADVDATTDARVVTLDWPELRREGDEMRATPIGKYPCDWRKPSRTVRCDPPGPPPPKRVAARIRRAGDDGSGAKIELDRGKKDGVESDWIGVVIDREGNIVTRGVKVVAVGEAHARGTVDLPRDAALSYERVVLLAPSEAADLP